MPASRDPIPDNLAAEQGAGQRKKVEKRVSVGGDQDRTAMETGERGEGSEANG